MTGNVLLLHMNNDTIDYSGLGNDGTNNATNRPTCNTTMTTGVFLVSC